MASDTEIANLALSHIGIGKEIANLTTENSQEANASRRFFVPSRDEVLRDFPWPFATRFVTLGLIEDDPTEEWDFSYGYPSDAVRMVRLLSGIRNDNRQSKVSYKVVSGNSGREIYTDLEDAQAEFTFRETDTQRYPPDFVMAFSYKLAMRIAPRLTRGDPFKLQDRVLRFYMAEIAKAQATSANEEQVDEAPDSEFIRTREGFRDRRGGEGDFTAFPSGSIIS